MSECGYKLMSSFNQVIIILIFEIVFDQPTNGKMDGFYPVT